MFIEDVETGRNSNSNLFKLSLGSFNRSLFPTIIASLTLFMWPNCRFIIVVLNTARTVLLYIETE